MSWFHRLANWIANRGGARDLYRRVEGKEPQLFFKRYYIIKTPFLQVMLHRFYLSDLPHMHDHPWPSISILLQRGYIEHVREGNEDVAHFRRPGYFGLRGAKSFHWVELEPESQGDVWTMFIVGPTIRSFGFLVDDKYIDSDEYYRLMGTAKVRDHQDEYKGWIFPVKKV